MTAFDEAKQKIEDKAFDHIFEIVKNGCYDYVSLKILKLEDVLAVFGDLHHAFEDLEGKCEEYAKLVARQAEQYAEKWVEAQKTVKTYIKFEMLEKKPKTEVYGIFSLSDESLLGKIYWYAPWRQYVFDPWRDTVWNRGCLENVRRFIEELMNARKLEKAEKLLGATK